MCLWIEPVPFWVSLSDVPYSHVDRLYRINFCRIHNCSFTQRPLIEAWTESQLFPKQNNTNRKWTKVWNMEIFWSVSQLSYHSHNPYDQYTDVVELSSRLDSKGIDVLIECESDYRGIYSVLPLTNDHVEQPHWCEDRWYDSPKKEFEFSSKLMIFVFVWTNDRIDRSFLFRFHLAADIHWTQTSEFLENYHEHISGIFGYSNNRWRRLLMKSTEAVR